VVTTAQLNVADSTAIAEVQAARVAKRSGPVGVLALSDTTVRTGRARYTGSNASSIVDMERIENAVEEAVTMVRLEQAGVDRPVIDDLNKLRIRIAAQRIGDRGRGGSAAAAIIVGIGLTMMLYMAIVLHGQNVLRGVMEEKTTRVAEVVLASVKPDTLLAGKVLGVGAVGLTQVVIWFGLILYGMWFIFPMLGLDSAATNNAQAAAAAGQSAPAMQQAMSTLSVGLLTSAIGFFVAGFIFYAAFYAAIGAMVNSEQEAQQAAIPVIFLLVGPMMFLNTVLFQPNGTLATVLSWLPFSSPIIMPMRMAMTSLPWYEVAGSLLVAFLGAAAVVWLAARIYRVGMLMYGKKPTLRELARWVRYA
jgi:ABC-2 type transport system permease protein